MPIDVVSKADGLRKSFFRSNRVIVSLFLVLWAIAVLVQFSAISFLAGEEGRTFLGVLVKSLGIMFSTLVLFFSFSSIQRRNRLINTGWIIYLLSVLGIVLVPFIGLEINGARRSLPMPIIGYSTHRVFQNWDCLCGCHGIRGFQSPHQPIGRQPNEPPKKDLQRDSTIRV